MTVQPAQLDHLAVEFETMIGELRFAEADGARDFIHRLRPAQQANLHGVQIEGAPGPTVLWRRGLSTWTVYATGSARPERRDALRALGQHTITLAQTDFEGQSFSRRLRVLNVAIDIEAGMVGQHVFGLGEDILDERRRNDAQRDFAVDAAEGQVVDLIAERRNVRPLAGIKIHRQHVFPSKSMCGVRSKEKGV